MWPRKGHLRSYNDVANLNIPQIRVITWSVKALLYVNRIDLTRETKWCQLEVCILFRSKVMIKFALNCHSATLCIGGVHLHVLTCSPLSHKCSSLGNGWADCLEIWYALGDPLVTAYAVLTGGASSHVRTCTSAGKSNFSGPDQIRPWASGSPLPPVLNVSVRSRGAGVSLRRRQQVSTFYQPWVVHTALLYLRNSSADCVQIWCVGWGSLPKCLPQVIDGVHPHVRTCALFRISRTDWPIVLKLDVRLEIQ